MTDKELFKLGFWSKMSKEGFLPQDVDTLLECSDKVAAWGVGPALLVNAISAAPAGAAKLLEAGAGVGKLGLEAALVASLGVPLVGTAAGASAGYMAGRLTGDSKSPREIAMQQLADVYRQNQAELERRKRRAQAREAAKAQRASFALI